MSRRLVLLAVLGAFFWQSCSSPTPQQGGSTAAAPHPVVLVVADGLRADRLGSYGGAAGLTPNLDRFADGAIRFEWAFAQTPDPDSSLASLLTALYATTHGLMEPGDRLVDEATTAAELFGAAGFASAAFLAGEAGRDNRGLAQGFEPFDWGPGAFDNGLSWLEEHATEDSFVLLGLPPLAAIPAGGEETIQRYGEQVAAVDQAFGRVLAALEAAGIGERATVAMVSLVGRDLGEHPGAGEPTLHAQVTRVPLLLRSPRLSGPRAVDNIVEVADLVPTLLDLVGEETPGEMQGRSLMALVGGTGTPPYVAFGESPAGGGRFFAALGGYRMLLHAESDAAELYDLAADPGELDDLAAGDERRVAVLRDHLGAWRKMTAAASLDPERRIEELDDDTLDQLKSLGYIQ